MRLIRISLSLFFCAVASACASTPANTAATEVTTQAATATTTWYAGTMTVSSADGATPYGPPKEALVARTVDEGAGTIVEVVVDEGALRKTTLRRQGESMVFAASDDAASFSGTVTMTGEGWNITGWSYDLKMADGSGRIVGAATVDGAGLRTEKYFEAPGGERKVRIVDALVPVSQAEYDAKLAPLLKPAG